MYGVGNYYNYYISVTKPADPLSHAATISLITLLYIFFICLRAYLFAEASLRDSQRIATQMDQIALFNNIPFYEAVPE